MMDPQRWEQVDAVFRAALERSSADRAAYLEAACGVDSELRQEVEELLASDSLALRQGFLGTGAPITPFPSASTWARSQWDTALIPLPEAREFGDYQLLEPVARGGMGVVYKARQKSLNRIVAIKMILGGPMASAELLGRFHSEAQAAANLQHPHIVAIHEVGEVHGQPYFSMDFVDGVALGTFARENPLAPLEAAQLLRQIADGVHYAHERGIIHRDLKPSNILIDRARQPRITDFGLAKRLEQDSELTGTGQVLGTPGYMPPEQASCKPDRIGPASDVYSLGAILYELLTGRPPFRGLTPMHTIMQALGHEPVSPRLLNAAVSRDLETICLKCLEKDPARRFATARELAEELERCLQGTPIHSRPVPAATRLWRWCRRKPATASAIMAATALILMLAIGGPLVAIREASLAQLIVRADAERIRARVDALRTAASQAVPLILEELAEQREDSLPYLGELWADPQLPAAERIRVSLALLPGDSSHLSYLRQRMLEVEASEVAVIRGALSRHSHELIEPLWQTLEQPKLKSEILPAASALSLYDPHSPRWNAVSSRVVSELVSHNRLLVSEWISQLQPVKDRLIEPLRVEFRSRGESAARARMLATDILADYTADQPERLVQLLADGDLQQFPVLFPVLRRHPDTARALMLEGLSQPPPQSESPPDAESSDIRRANLAVGLLQLGRPDVVWPLLKHSPDPTVRSHLIQRLGPLGTDWRILIDQLHNEPDESIRRALILSLGGISADRLPEGDRQALVSTLIEWYRNDPDPGIHGATMWLLRNWNQEQSLHAIDAELSTGAVEGERKWFVTRQGHTMVIIPGPVEFQMGLGLEERDRTHAVQEHRRRIPRSYAIASQMITVQEYAEFLRDHPDPRHEIYTSKYSPEPNCPQIGVTWFNAARYCRWLSEQEGIPEEQMCFPPIDEIKTGMRLPQGYLRRLGYRLPTEAEWEFACQAGANTIRHHGRSEELIGSYDWYIGNSNQRSWPVGLLKPNDFGLFDMHGNVRGWCQHGHQELPADRSVPAIDQEDLGVIQDLTYRSIKGGSFNDHTRFLRAAVLISFYAETGSNLVGMRIVRTLPD